MNTASSEIYRAKALVAEQRGQEVGNYDFKCEWEDIAIEWHALASRVALESSKSELEVQ